MHLKQVKIDQGEELRKVCTAGICVIKQIMGICPYTPLQRIHLIKINVFNENQFSSEIFGQYRETEKEGICKLVFFDQPLNYTYVVHYTFHIGDNASSFFSLLYLLLPFLLNEGAKVGNITTFVKSFTFVV